LPTLNLNPSRPCNFVALLLGAYGSSASDAIFSRIVSLTLRGIFRKFRSADLLYSIRHTMIIVAYSYISGKQRTRNRLLPHNVSAAGQATVA